MADRWRVGPGLALVGGAIWAAHAVVLGRRPPGCVSEECGVTGASHRPSEDLAWLLLLAVAALAVAVGRLAAEGRDGGRLLLRASSVLLWAGAGLLAGGMVVNAVLPDDSPLWWLHDSDSLGRLVPVAGAFVGGCGIVRSRRPSPWVGALLVVASVIAVPFNAQDDRALLSVPLGLAWVVTGAWWVARPGARHEARAARG
ncbi:hypothetical protein [Blastococcus sp. SYSU DS0973]